ncbi:MAG TPA: hypothetical protein VMT35_08415 [Ignavibacteriaceae bacterium]|nr:hypothetical protein [Ignavibacteriaceae bacterium]
MIKTIIAALILFSSAVLPQQKYFYDGKSYGSEAIFNPLTLIINGGFDIFQLYETSNKLNDHDYYTLYRVVMRSLGHPARSMKAFGFNHILRTELLPISFTRNKMQWIPNYQNHLIGGGMDYAKMKEWYESYGTPVPWLFSSVTVMLQHLLNEMMESGPDELYSMDEIVDIYVFDLGGIILFSFDNIQRFFSGTLNLNDWSLQPAYLFPEGRLHAGQYFVMKWKFPFEQKWGLFFRYGLGGVFGLTESMNNEDNLSFGIGFRTKHLVDLSTVRRERTIETGWQAGLFWDKNNSLMASLVMSGIREAFIMADIYPGIIHLGDFSPGLWTQIGRDGHASIGVATKWAIGLGYGKY